MPRTKPTKQSKVHYPKVSPRLLERYANIDGRCTDEIKNRNDWIRKVLEDAVEHGAGFDKVKNKKNKALNITFADIMSKSTFTRYKAKVVKNSGSGQDLDFSRSKGGMTAAVTNESLVKIAQLALKRNGEGNEMTVSEAKSEMDKYAAGPLSKKQYEAGLKKLRVTHRINLRAPDTNSVAQHREDHDIRNPIMHAVGWIGVISLEDGSYIDPRLRFNFDFTGVGVRLMSKADAKVLHPSDSTLPPSAVSKGSNMVTNMKLASASNDYGHGMLQVYVFKLSTLPEESMHEIGWQGWPMMVETSTSFS